MASQFLRSTIAVDVLTDAPVYARSGVLDVRVATSQAEVEAAQALRYQIFYGEMGARPDAWSQALQRDIDAYDAICDHLLVLDHSVPDAPEVVGTYRLLRQVTAQQHRGFYSQSEYDLKPILSAAFQSKLGDGKQLLELGRSCVHKRHRSAATITLLWQGIASYLHQHSIGYMFGCASFPGTDPSAHRVALSYLHHHHQVPPDLHVCALPDRFVDMNMIASEALDVKLARRALPPLIKGYLRLGCYVGHGAVVDPQFNTTDVFILLPVERITKRYSSKFVEAGAQRVH
ncbi:MAG: GNAT family N-acyltransferase [Pseudomonadota bacterium]